MIRIAVVEDLDGEAQQLMKCIEQYGREKNETFAVERFSDGLAFIEEYHPRYDIIFMDIQMQFIQHLESHIDLPLSSIDHNQIRQGTLLVEQT